MTQVPNQARFYELQGSLHRAPDEEAEEERGHTRGLAAVPHPGDCAVPPEPPGPRAVESGAEAGAGTGAKQGRSAAQKRLPMWVRVSLIVVAVLLVALGIAGLFLPGLQGILTLLLALAMLSLVSRTMHRLLRWALQPWPKLRKKVERHRRRSHGWLHDKVDRLARWREERRRQRRERRCPEDSAARSEPGSRAS